MDTATSGELFTPWGDVVFAEHGQSPMWNWIKGRGRRSGGRAISANRSHMLEIRLNAIQRELESIRVDLNGRIDNVKKAIDEALQE